MEDVARKQQLYVITGNGKDPGTSSSDPSPGRPPACPSNGPAIIPVQNNTFQLALAALGVVYGDIGTSPLYAVRECFSGPHAITLSEVNLFGVVSLIFWSLTIVVTVKYLGRSEEQT